VCGHGLAVMRNQNPPDIGSFVEDGGVWYTDNACRAGVLEIDRSLTAAQTKNDLVVEVSVA